MCAVPSQSDEGIRPSGTEVINVVNCHVGARGLDQVLCKSNKYSLMMSLLSSPKVFFLFFLIKMLQKL